MLRLLPLLCTGSLQIRYNLGGTREPYNIDVDHRNMANGQPHSVNITRREKTITLKVRTCVHIRVCAIQCGDLCPLHCLHVVLCGFVLEVGVGQMEGLLAWTCVYKPLTSEEEG